MPSVVRAAYRMIGEASPKPNFPTPAAPWVLRVQAGANGCVKTKVLQSDGYTFPFIDRYAVRAYGQDNKWWRTYFGTTKRCAFQKALPQMIAYRDIMNIIFAISQGKRRVTEDDMKSITDPALKIKVVEAVCMAVAQSCE